MFGLSFRQIFPRSFYGRSVLLTIFPVTLSLALIVFYYFNSHLRTVNAKLSQAVAREISLVQETCNFGPEDAAAQAAIELRLNLIYDCRFDAAAVPALPEDSFFYRALVRDTLASVLGPDVSVAPIDQMRRIDIRVGADAYPLRVVVERKRVMDINSHVFIIWVVGFSLLMTATALAFLRNHVRSILRLAQAAQAFGTGREVGDFRPSGAREVRAAANAVIEMRQRLTAFAEQRTMMLAGVSHDLRTPLARLQLQLAMQEQSSDIKDARADIRDMEAMLDEYLAFARGEDGEQAEPVDLVDLLKEIAARFPVARYVDTGQAPEPIVARPLALKRALANLVANAVTYGETAEVSLQVEPDWIVIRVDDDGPGIPPEQYEDAFRSFSRLDEARSQNKPGVGLGLALTRDTARAHGGQVSLQPSPLGGLRAELRLPR